MSSTFTISARDVQEMARHWLSTPVNGYLGSDYGQDGKSMLQKPLENNEYAEEFLAKLRRDVPVFSALPPEMTRLEYEDHYPDKREIFLRVIGQTFQINADDI